MYYDVLQLHIGEILICRQTGSTGRVLQLLCLFILMVYMYSKVRKALCCECIF